MTKPRCPNEAVPKIHARQCGQMVYWFYWSKDKGLPVKHMEDLVFVYGCTLVTSWAAAAFDDDAGEAQVSLACRPLNNGGSSFVWSNIRRTVEYHDSQLDPVCSLLVAFIRRALTFSIFLLKEWSLRTSESMRLHQMPSSKAHHFLG